MGMKNNAELMHYALQHQLVERALADRLLWIQPTPEAELTETFMDGMLFVN